jgi:hypothetical protein
MRLLIFSEEGDGVGGDDDMGSRMRICEACKAGKKAYLGLGDSALSVRGRSGDTARYMLAHDVGYYVVESL